MDETTSVRIDGKFLPLHQLLDLIEGDEDDSFENEINITLLPPTNATDDMTDEDSGEEDNVNIDNVPRSQINAPALLDGINLIADEPEVEEQQPDEPFEPEATTSKLQKTPKRKNNNFDAETKKAGPKRSKTEAYDWEMNRDLQISSDDWQPLVTVANDMKTPLEYFEMFFDEDVISLMVKYTNQYAAKKNRLGDCSENEMRSFICI